MDRQESERSEQHVFFSEGVELADQLADRSIAILYFGHLNEKYCITIKRKGIRVCVYQICLYESRNRNEDGYLFY